MFLSAAECFIVGRIAAAGPIVLSLTNPVYRSDGMPD